MKLLGAVILFSVGISMPLSSTQAGGALLFDNGPIITQSGTGLGGADESVLENNTLSMLSFGSAHQLADSLRVADDFTVPTNGWQISAIDFYAYQTNETASTITALNLRIWDGPPGQPGSQAVFGDTSTNLLSSTINSGILRVNEDTQGMNDSRQIALSTVAIDVTLPGGTYWLDWQSDGSGTSGIFVPHITIPGQTTTGNALLSTDNGANYADIRDSGTLTPQGLPFVIRGSVGTVTQVPTLSITALILLALMFLIISQRSGLMRTSDQNH